MIILSNFCNWTLIGLFQYDYLLKANFLVRKARFLKIGVTQNSKYEVNFETLFS